MQDPTALIADLYAGVLDEAAWPSAMVGVADLAGAGSCHLIAVDLTTNRILRDEPHRTDPALVSAYRKHWSTQDPLVRPVLKIMVGQPMPEHALLPPDQWTSSALYNELAVPFDMPHVLATVLYRSPDKLVALSLKASFRHGPFQPDDTARLREVIPHLRRVLEVKDQLAISQVRADTIAKSLDSLSFGIVVLDVVGRVVESNSVADEIFRAQDSGIQVNSQRRIHAREPAGAALYRWIIGGKPPPQNFDGLLHIPRFSKQPISLLVSPLPEKTKSWIAGDPRWMLLLFDPERRFPVSVELVSRDLGISTREAEVAALLAVGNDIKGIAARLRITANTARTHLKSIFSKTGIRSQSELIRRVASGPAIVSRD